jgi:hypothetical protein
VIQVRKRSAIDLAPLLGVQPILMAKTAGAFLSSVARDANVEGRVEDLEVLAELAFDAEGHLGGGRWGYEFDVQTRWAYYPKGTPNLIATFFVGRGFGEAGAAIERQEWLREFHAAAEFMDGQLWTRSKGHGSFYRYVPESSTLVHNANLLGAGLVAASAAIRGDAASADRAIGAAMSSIQAQRADGSWPYGEGGHIGWNDNFHTAYNLDGLLLLWLATGDAAVEQSLRAGVEYWSEHFFGPLGESWYGPDGRGPIDIHSAGTAMDVGSRLASWGFVDPAFVERIAEWSETNMTDSKTGMAYHRLGRAGVDRRRFPRWNEAHLALGRSSVRVARDGRRTPLEAAVREVVPDAR